MNYQDALKQAKANEKEDKRYLTIAFGYRDKYVFPYKEGMAFIQALEKAERIESHYSETPDITIKPLIEDDINITVLNGDEYRHIKMAMLLKVNVKDIKELANQT